MELPPLSADVLDHYRRCIPGLHTVDGIPWHGSMFPLENFDMRDDDVLVSGYPKSGLHRFYFCFHFICYAMDEKSDKYEKVADRNWTTRK